MSARSAYPRVCSPHRFTVLLLGLLVLPAVLAGADPGRGARVEVLENTPDRIVVQFTLTDYESTPVVYAGEAFTLYSVPGESRHMLAGEPLLPCVVRSVIIPPDAEMALEVLAEEWVEVPDVRIPPGRGHFSRAIDPDSVPLERGPVYDLDAWFPAEVIEAGRPYGFRDHRGLTLGWNPLRYNPVRQALRICTVLRVELRRSGPGEINVLPPGGPDLAVSLSFEQTYARHFINYAPRQDYAPLVETGRMLILCADALTAGVVPLAAHRSARGMPVTFVPVSQIPGGNNPAAIRAFIQSQYALGDLAFVLLAGDAELVATPTAWGGAADPTYARISGDDPYPDVLIGRLSAETPAELATQVQRTIQHELQEAWAQPWHWRATGIASAQGAGIGHGGASDIEHIEDIRRDLLAFGYTTVDQIYDPGASAAAVSTALNAGRGLVNYCGHGTAQIWSTTGFSAWHVQNLLNEGRLPFIVTVACINGDFAGRTCFAEIWLRAQRLGQPIGAVAMYASSIDQYWAPPMVAQAEIVTLLTERAYATLGALCFAGAARMIDEYGFYGAQMFDTWHLFGDPALTIGVRQPRAPRAENLQRSTFFNTAVDVALLAIDDGLPDPPGLLTYQITALPGHGRLWHGPTPLLTAPATLPPGERVVRYLPNPGFGGLDVFQYRATDGGQPPGAGWSQPATVSVRVGGRQVVYNFNLSSDPGWLRTGEWQYGRPTGQGGADGGVRDPTSGATGPNVFGINLHGDYALTVGPPQVLRTGPLDLFFAERTQLHFRRWLNCDSAPFVICAVEVSNDGQTWHTLWENDDQSVTDASWREITLDAAAYADGRSRVYFRWIHQVGDDGAYAYSGWNIDDIQLSSDGPFVTQRGDLDCNGVLNFADIPAFILALNGATVYAQAFPDCNRLLADMNDDGQVSFFDIDPFIQRIAAATAHP